MRKINSFKELKKGDMVFYTYKKNEDHWIGFYDGEINFKYYFDLTCCADGHRQPEHSVNELFFREKQSWKIYKLTKKEFDELALKIVVNKI